MSKDIHGKKFISPGAWFSLVYPQDWYEFEDTEESFLFYNPEKWSGNFRISAYRKDRKQPGASFFAKDSIREELQQNPTATLVDVGSWKCAYSMESFQEEGQWYTLHLWVTGVDNLLLECSFTVPRGGDAALGRSILASVECRDERKSYPKEIIPVRVLEIGEVNAAFEWVSSVVKKELKKDFTGVVEDLGKLQQIIDGRVIEPGQQDAWAAFGLVMGTIFTNEMDGLEWMTVIDGRREYPALRYSETGTMIYPQKWVADAMKKNGTCHVMDVFDKAMQFLSTEKEENHGK